MRILFTLMMLCFAKQMLAQVTTAGIRGLVTADGKLLEAVSIKVVNEPTGSVHYTTTQRTGNYTIPNLQTGGPYSMTFTYVGQASKTVDNVYLTLGNYYVQDIELEEQTQELSNIVVTGIGKGKRSAGIVTSINKEQLERLPTLNRSLQDFTKLSPQSNGNSFAGANYRFNNLSIDGAALNDAFGFTEPASGAGGSQATGSPGGLAKTQPISLEAVQEVQVQISPYTVTLGNFTGGSVNVVTRSGTNKPSGSVFVTGRNRLLTGPSADDQRSKIDEFYNVQSGFRFGGPIIQTKLFFFVAGEIARRSEPVQFAPGTAGAAIPIAVAKAISDTLQARYNYDSKGYGETNLIINSDKLFARVDWNISRIHKLSVRNNYVNAFANNLERSANILNFGSQGYRHNSVTSSTVAELKSNFNNRIANNLIVGYTSTNDDRETKGKFFPHIEITFNTANTIFAGTYREAALYGLGLKTFEFTDNLTLYKNKHTFTLGTHNEFYKVDYRFLTSFNGRWAYSSVENFFANRPSRIRGVYSLTNNNVEFNRSNPSAKFDVYLLGQYLQDEYAVTKNLRLTAGLRLDFTSYPDREAVNDDVKATPGFGEYANASSKEPQFAPRLGVDWDVNGKQKLFIKAGAGLFNGRMPFAWLAYPYYNNGSKYGNIDMRPTTVVPLEPSGNVEALAANFQPGIREINLLDNNYKLPQVFRTSVGIERRTSGGWKFNFEAVYTKTLQDVLYKSINIKDSTSTLSGAGDNRVVFFGNGDQRKINKNFTNVFLLSNTNKGYRYQLSGTVTKAIKKFTASTTYTYGESKDISNGVRVSPQANWEFNQTILANEPKLAYSNFDLRHRSFTNLQYARIGKKSNSFVTLTYTAQSGSPFTYTYIGDINRDGSPNNDLIYIPGNIGESRLTDIKNGSNVVLITAAEQWANLDNYIKNDKYLSKRRGEYAERNGARTPWNHQLDIKITQALKLNAGKKNEQAISISLDVFNVSNLISKNWGKQYYVPNILNSSYQLLTVARATTAQNPELNFNLPTTTPWQFDPILSRAQGALTVRYTF